MESRNRIREMPKTQFAKWRNSARGISEPNNTFIKKARPVKSRESAGREKPENPETEQSERSRPHHIMSEV